MLDGAGASTFLDLIDERNQEEIKKNSKIIDTTKDNNEVPFANTARDQNKKNVVFIDSAVSDYETIINSFKENTEFYLINSNEDGFKRISEILNDRKDIDGLHIIGHGSAGEILFGNAFLNNDTITNYQSTLASIGQSLTTSGDILFYGCNVASTEQGEILIKKISEITKADIAASDDITGKSGDWDLEKKYGIIETRNVQVLDYQSDLLQDGISSLSSIGEYTGTDLRKGQGSESSIQIKLENQNLTLSSTDYVGEFPINSSLSFSGNNAGYISTSGSFSHPNGHYETLQNATGSSASANVNSYIVFLRSSTSTSGSITFDGEILGIFLTPELIAGGGNNISNKYSGFGNKSAGGTYITNIFDNTYENTSLTYESNVQGGYVLEDNSASSSLSSITYRYGNTGNINSNNDRIAVTSSGGTNNILSVSMSNGSGGDYIRVIVKPSTNTAPTASNGTVYINENNKVSSAGDRTPSNITKIFAASDFNYSDGDSDSLSKIKITTLESAGTLEYSDGSSWSDVTENQEITASDIGNNRLRFTPAANSESNPTFGFKVHDGTEYSSSAYTMTISVNAAPDVTDTTVGSTVSAGGTSSGDVHDGVTDSDDADSVLVVTGVASGNESSNNSIVTDNTGVGSAVSGTYGSLNIAANGTYTYTASSTNSIAYG